MANYTTYHKDVPIHKDALRVNEVIESSDIISPSLKDKMLELVDSSNMPTIIGIDSNEHYLFYYLSNGDRIDVTK